MLNFTVGPVTCANDIASIGGEQIPYFRTAEFSALMKENEALIRSLSGAPENSRAVFITGSGTASMEAAVANVLTPEDKALVINGGSFGARFAELCAIHSVPFEELRKQSGAAVTAEDSHGSPGADLPRCLSISMRLPPAYCTTAHYSRTSVKTRDFYS